MIRGKLLVCGVAAESLTTNHLSLTTKPNEPLAVTTATSGVIGDVNVIQEAFDGSQIINKVSVTASKSTTQTYGFVGNQFPERNPIQSLATSKTISEVRSASGLVKDNFDHSEVARIIGTSASKTKTTTAVNIYTPTPI